MCNKNYLIQYTIISSSSSLFVVTPHIYLAKGIIISKRRKTEKTQSGKGKWFMSGINENGKKTQNSAEEETVVFDGE